MQCPIDKADLVMSEHHGIEVDYRPKCCGAWLDRDEIGKIIERAGSTAAQPAEDYRPSAPPRHEPHYDKRHHEKPYYKKRKSFLDDIFDF